MSTRNPLDELESLLKTRAADRSSYLNVFLGAIPSVSRHASDWFNFEVDILKKELELLRNVMPDETDNWSLQFRNVTAKFEGALEVLQNIAKKAERGEVKSVSEIYQRPSTRSDLLRMPPRPLTEEEKEEEELDLASAILNIFDATGELEKLVEEVESEARRTLRLRRLVRIEIEKQLAS